MKCRTASAQSIIVAGMALAATAGIPATAATPETLPAYSPTIIFNNAPVQSGVVIAPFSQTSPQDQYAWISKAIDENLRTDLSGNVAVQIKSAGGSSDDVEQARAAGASIFIRGSYQISGSDLRILAQVHDVPSGQTLSVAKASGNVSDLFKLEDEISAQVLRVIPGAMPLSNKPYNPDASAAVTVVGDSPAGPYSYSRILDGQSIAFESTGDPAVNPYSTVRPQYVDPYPSCAPVTQVYNTYVYPQPTYGYEDVGLWSPFYYGGPGFLTVSGGAMDLGRMVLEATGLGHITAITAALDSMPGSALPMDALQAHINFPAQRRANIFTIPVSRWAQ